MEENARAGRRRIAGRTGTHQLGSGTAAVWGTALARARRSTKHGGWSSAAWLVLVLDMRSGRHPVRAVCQTARRRYGELFQQGPRLQRCARGMTTDIARTGGKLGKGAVENTDDALFHVTNLRHQISPQPGQLTQALHRVLRPMRTGYLLQMENRGNLTGHRPDQLWSPWSAE